MDIIKIGRFIQTLRKEKGLTQEQLAEHFGVARRTVSRWETGSNMPDLDILMELADFYEVDLREILNGERKNEEMDKELKETVRQVAEYSNEEKEKLRRRMHFIFMTGTFAVLVAGFIILLGLETRPVFEKVAFICMGYASGMTIGAAILTSKLGPKIRAFKMRLLRKEF